MSILGRAILRSTIFVPSDRDRGIYGSPMKALSLALIWVGALGLVVAVVEKFIGKHLLGVSPANYVLVASALFLLALAMMYYGRCYCTDSEKK